MKIKKTNVYPEFWQKCWNCHGSGKSASWDDSLGRVMSETWCPTCQGNGGWPLITKRMQELRFNPRRLQFPKLKAIHIGSERIPVRAR